MAWAKVHWAVTCIKHGVPGKGDTHRWVKVGVPKGKLQRREGGCPLCKQIAIAEAKMNRDAST